MQPGNDICSALLLNKDSASGTSDSRRSWSDTDPRAERESEGRVCFTAACSLSVFFKYSSNANALLLSYVVSFAKDE